MESIVGNIWSSQRLSRFGWLILNLTREEIQALPLFQAPSTSFFHPVDPMYSSFANSHFLHDLLENIMSAMHGYSRAPRDNADNGELATRVLWALVLLQRERLPGMHETCFICGSQEVERNDPWPQDSPCVSMRRRHLSSSGNWTLNEISILPYLRDVDSPRLCTRHASWFTRTSEAMLGLVYTPLFTPPSAATHLEYCRRPSDLHFQGKVWTLFVNVDGRSRSSDCCLLDLHTHAVGSLALVCQLLHIQPTNSTNGVDDVKVELTDALSILTNSTY